EIEPPPAPNPMQEWARLAKLGSYGQVSLNINQTVSNRTSPREVDIERETKKRETASKPQKAIQTRTTRSSARRSSKTIPAGSSAKAVLATPLYGETTKLRRRGNENEDNNVYVVRLKQTLKAADGTAALTKGSQIFTKNNSISESGLMRLEIVKIMTREKGEIV
ncbi:MAG: hypothetical protein MJK14_08120, partial [Rivularia sp. ALOHA_DT_140]|nr:hypothetical protein [Rivularia sp. ALOHA_DT_140]